MEVLGAELLRAIAEKGSVGAQEYRERKAHELQEQLELYQLLAGKELLK